MRRSVGFLAFAALFAVTTQSRAADVPPPWAFAVNPPITQLALPITDDGLPKHVAGSSLGLTLAQVKEPFNVPDWHPDNHPPAPDIVAHGRKPSVLGCGFCHLPNGLGRPENAGLAGLPAGYIAQQIADFRSGARQSAIADLAPPKLMVAIAKAATDDEVKEAAAYFASLDLKPWIRVVEAATVPKSHVAGYMLVPDAGGAREPIGQRIVETPENLAQTELRDSGSGFVAYVPPGASRKVSSW
ncbi:MAG: cytochrome C-binding protein [Rhodospirillales bacterium]|nr:cytochrome C-binding protein [Rhodospirillales bacterium]